jgi:signal transduction histidine kinase
LEVGVDGTTSQQVRERSLTWLAGVIAACCLAVDLVDFSEEVAGLPIATRAGALVVIAAADALLALPPKWTSPVAAAHALVAVGLALVLPATPNTDWGLAGGMIAAYRAGAWLRRRASGLALAALAGAAAAGSLISYHPTAVSVTAAAVANALIPWLVGRYTSARRGHVAELRYNRELELRDAKAELERASDRLRESIARDLHDGISHHVSAIGAHAGAARLRLAVASGTDPEVVASVAAVEESSRAAMFDLRRALDVLHKAPESVNQIGLDNLGELLDGVRRSGQEVGLKVSGEPRKLPGSADVALYRIVQELLTNAMRHGDGRAIELELDYQQHAVSLRSRNGVGPGPDGGPPSSGRGLAGIRGRAELFGGKVSAGPRSGGRLWEAEVEIPYETTLFGAAW